MTTYKLVDAIGRLKEDPKTDWERFKEAAMPFAVGFDPREMAWHSGRYPSGGKVHGNPGPQWVESLRFANLKMILTIGAAYLQTPGYEHLASTWLGPIERIVQLAEESE